MTTATAPTQLNPGRHCDIPMGEYRREPFPSYSYLNKARQTCWQVAQYELTNPKDPTNAMILGTDMHTAAYVDYQLPLNRADYPSCKGAGKTANKNFAFLEGARQALHDHPHACALLYGKGPVELSIVAQVHGTLIKCRPDKICREHRVIVDLKSAADASPEAFSKSLYNGYALQASLYLDAARQAGEDVDTFAFVVVEKTPPYPVAVYVPHEDALQWAELELKRLLAEWNECKSTDHWPGYTEQITRVDIPAWAHRREQQ